MVGIVPRSEFMLTFKEKLIRFVIIIILLVVGATAWRLHQSGRAVTLNNIKREITREADETRAETDVKKEQLKKDAKEAEDKFWYPWKYK